jgi:hypothetical protein
MATCSPNGVYWLSITTIYLYNIIIIIIIIILKKIYMFIGAKSRGLNES